MNEITTLLDEFERPDINDSNYMYNGIVVPRVTHIISKCIHSEGLMHYANNLGFRHQSYTKTLAASANIGTICHENIDEFMENRAHVLPDDIPYQSRNAYKSFLKWFSDISVLAWDLEVLMHEQPLVCKYFGGCLDGLYRINGLTYLVDYKTSNHVTINHLIQASAYRYILRTEMNINIDGVIILQLSKDDISYNEHVLNFANPDHLKFINECERMFLSLVYSYYNITYMEDQYKKLQWGVL